MEHVPSCTYLIFFVKYYKRSIVFSRTWRVVKVHDIIGHDFTIRDQVSLME